MSIVAPKINLDIRMEDGAEVVVLGDMLEFTQFDPVELAYKTRWDAIVNGDHRVYPGGWVKDDSKSPEINKYREKARKAFKKDEQANK
jgi:hypothetical protein